MTGNLHRFKGRTLGELRAQATESEKYLLDELYKLRAAAIKDIDNQIDSIYAQIRKRIYDD